MKRNNTPYTSNEYDLYEYKRQEVKAEINQGKLTPISFSKTPEEKDAIKLAKARYKNLISKHAVRAKELRDELIGAIIGSKVPKWDSIVVNS